MGVEQDVKLGETQIEIWGGEGVEVEAHDVGAFVGDGEGVSGGACENPSGVVDWGGIGEGVVVLERKGVGGRGEGGAVVVVGGEVTGEVAVVDEGGGGGGAAVDEVIVGGIEEVGEGGEGEEEEEEEEREESRRHNCER